MALAVAMPWAWVAPAHALPTFAQVQQTYRPSDTLVLDRYGEVLQRVRTDASVRRGQWVALAQVSPALRHALVLTEDKRFYEHSGVDWQAVTAAAWGNVWSQRTRGASTITMQLAGLLDEDLQGGRGGRSVVQKMGQTVAAQVLDSRWRKDHILEAYLNLVPFRGELVGIDALSRTLFDKAPHGLNDREAAVAVALVRAPNASAAQVARRACAVWKDLQTVVPHLAPEAAHLVPVDGMGTAAAQLGRGAVLALRAGAPLGQGTPTLHADASSACEAMSFFVTAALQRRAFDTSAGSAPHFARYVLRQLQRAPSDSAPSSPPPSALVTAPMPDDGAQEGVVEVTAAPPLPLQVRTTVRAGLQHMVATTVRQHLRQLRGRNVEDAAVLVLDNASGEVLAWLGSSGDLSQAREVDAVLAWRQPGSTLKPFLYAQALAERRLTAASLIEDSSAQLATSSGLYIPQNYDRRFKGWVSVRTALASSLNVPAVRTLVMVTPDAFVQQLADVGLPLRQSGGYYGYSLALGSAEVPLLHLTNAFRTLANAGRYSPVVWLRPQGQAAHAGPSRPQAAPAASRQALDATAAFVVGDILSDSYARAPTFGTDSVLATRFWSAVKTGTSKDMRDNWALGWSQRYTVGVWVGNASGEAMHDVSGTSGAAPIWAEVMGFLHAREPSVQPAPPRTAVRMPVRFGAEVAATTGSVSTQVQPLEASRTEWFLPGTEQAVFAIDSAGDAGASGRALARIVTPTSGTIVALDPDIPPAHQRLQLSATGHNVRWVMDGKPLASGNTVSWFPWPGRHVLQLLNAQGQVQDTVRLEVRGAGVVPGARMPASTGTGRR